MDRELPKRSEVKSWYRPALSESIPEHELNHQLLKLGMRGEKQYPVGPFFADIGFPGAKVDVEYDGEIHIGQESKDEKRDKFFQSLGWRVIRVNKLMDLAETAKYIAEIVLERDRKMLTDYASEKMRSLPQSSMNIFNELKPMYVKRFR